LAGRGTDRPAGHGKADAGFEENRPHHIPRTTRLTDVAASMVSIRMAYGGREGRRPPTAATPDDREGDPEVMNNAPDSPTSRRLPWTFNFRVGVRW
jgi:epoxyqueuosine reductase QueG